MAQPRCDLVTLTGVRDSLARAFDLFGLGRRVDEPQLLILLAAAQAEIAGLAGCLSGPVASFWPEWVALTAAQIERLRESNQPTRVELGAALLSLEFLISVMELQLCRDGVPDHCASCDSPNLAPIAGQATMFECLACGLRTAYPA
jgi:hypothetical protein